MRERQQIVAISELASPTAVKWGLDRWHALWASSYGSMMLQRQPHFQPHGGRAQSSVWSTQGHVKQRRGPVLIVPFTPFNNNESTPPVELARLGILLVDVHVLDTHA